jgi:hypothetical protein
MIALRDYQRLTDAVEELGGKTPKSVAAVYQTVGAWRQAAAGSVVYPRDVILNSLIRAGKKGRGMEKVEVQDLADAKYEEARGLPEMFLQPVMEVEHRAAEVVRDLLLGEAGDQLVGSLQGEMAKAIGVIQEAAASYGPDVTADRVIELGMEAVAAWRKAEKAGAYLDQVLNTVARPMTILELIPPEVAAELGAGHLLGILVAERAEILNEVGLILSHPTTAFKIPGERWIRIFRLADGIRLNSPRKAAEIYEGIRDAELLRVEQREQGLLERNMSSQPTAEDIAKQQEAIRAMRRGR